MFPIPWVDPTSLRFRRSVVRSRRLGTRLRLTPLEERLVPATFRWTNPAGGEFAVASNWADENGNAGVPSATDDALVLTPGITVTSVGTSAVRKLTSLATLNVSAGSLTAAAANLLGPAEIAGGSLVLGGPSRAVTVDLNGGTLGGGGQLDLSGGMTWSGGAINLTLHVQAGATIDLTGTAPKVLDGATVTNDGTITWGGTGNLAFLHTSAVRNSGIIHDLADHAATFSGATGESAVLQNSGQFVKEAGAGTTDIGIPFDNTGRLQVESGSVRLSDAVPQLQSGNLAGGVWHVDAGAAIDFAGAILSTNNADITLDGPGASIAALTDLTFNSGDLILTDGASFVSGLSFFNGGRLTIGPGSTFTTNGFTQASPAEGTPARLTFQVAGRPASNQFGQVVDNGQTEFDSGTVELTVLSGADVVVGDQYALLSSTNVVGTPDGLVQSGVGTTPPFTIGIDAAGVSATAVANVTDLAVAVVNASATPLAPGDDLSVSWTVQNNATFPTSVTSWTDSIYLSAAPVLDDTAILVGSVAHSGSLATSTSYNGVFTGPLPGLLPGVYHVFVVADADALVPDANRANNAGTSAAGLTVSDLPVSQVLTLGTQTNGTVAAGGDVWYRVDVPGGTAVQVTAGFATAGAGELYVDYRSYPQPGTALGTAADPTATTQQVLLSATQAGAYYIRVRGAAAGGGSFTILADVPAFGITRLVNATGSNRGFATLTVHGIGLTSTAEVRLVQGATTRAGSMRYVDSSIVYATFDLRGLAPGNFDVRIDDDDRSATAVASYLVTTATAGALSYHITPPASLPVGQEAIATIDFINSGGTDLPVPLLLLSDVSLEFGLRLPEVPPPGNPLAGSTHIYFLPTSTDAPAGVIPPGYHGRIEVVVSRRLGTDPINLSLEEVNLGKPITWKYFSTIRPDDIRADAWPAVFASFQTAVGSTSTGYIAALRNAATYLATIGSPARDASVLLGYLIRQADAPLAGNNLDQVTDANFPTAGLSLQFVRSFGPSIQDRNWLGRLGRGWIDNWDVTLTSPTGAPPAQFSSLVLHAGGRDRVFAADSDFKTYRPVDAEDDILTFDGVRFVLAQDDGATIAFRTDGQPDVFQDPGGTSVTATYDAKAHMVQLTHSDGRALTFTWSSAGRIASVTDPGGRVIRFAYSGQHLVSATGPGGVEKYSYLGGPAARAHALASITAPGGVKTSFTYDTRGRLIRRQLNGGIAAVSYAYGDGGGVTATDGSGRAVSLLPDANGRIAKLRDTAGTDLHVTYDSAGQATRIETSVGQVWTTTLDAEGHVTAVTDPLGHVLQYTFDDDLVSGITDARGNTTNFQFDAADNTRSITYPGPSGGTESFVYDPTGNLVETVNRRGHAILFLTNADGQVTSRVLADGSHTDYVYDDRGNLVSATDASGTTTLTFLANDLLGQVTYPDGRFLQFTYDKAGRRSSSVDQDGFRITYVYDAAGQLGGLRDSAKAYIVKYHYDKAGQIIRKEHANGTSSTYDYDPTGRLVRLTNQGGGQAVNSQFDYTYDAAGRVATMTTDGATTAYGYDLTGQLVSVVAPGRTITYTYDAAGNRTSVTDNGVTTNYVVNELNEVAAIGGTTFTYDADGNRTSTTDVAGTTTYAWNDLNQLTSVTAPMDTFAYAYDVFDHQWQATHNGATTTNLTDPTDPGTVTAQYGPGGLIAHFVTGLGLEARVAADGGRAFFDFDRLGDVVGLTNAAGTYVNKYSYLPFGETTTLLNGIADNPFTFVGQWGVSSDGNGLFNMRARSYDPGAGSFVSDDPIGFSGGDSNIRRYVGNNVLQFIDPTGLKCGGSSELKLLDDMDKTLWKFINMDDKWTDFFNGISKLSYADAARRWDKLAKKSVALRTKVDRLKQKIDDCFPPKKAPQHPNLKSATQHGQKVPGTTPVPLF
ncbi:MAG TPA: RHS repeat-associated core domain-containing protein [Gemmataceae bacterium]|jgi:RHS repeat-associated protein|nr:RHS repeat-associated core domain-containing protein [Gemmataceae bacterium]